jgi:hypothetical protein
MASASMNNRKIVVIGKPGTRDRSYYMDINSTLVEFEPDAKSLEMLKDMAPGAYDAQLILIRKEEDN